MSIPDSLSAEGRGGRNPLRTLQHGLRALEAISRSPGGQLSARELEQQLGLRQRACYHLLETLSQEGYVVRFVGGQYGIGPRLERLNVRFSSAVAPDPRVLEPFARLSEQFDSLGSINGWYGSDIIVQLVCPDQLRGSFIGVGYRDQLTSRCSTKAILAFVGKRQLLRYFASHAHPATTKRTITDFEPFRNHLLEVAEHGYALDLAETVLGWCGVAAPFFTSSGFPLGSFGMSAPLETFSERREAVVEAVTVAALEASRALGYSGAYPPPSPLRRK